MPPRQPSPPRSYEDIARSTVIEPDGSWRPSLEQEIEGRARTGPGYPEEDALRRAIVERLSDAGIGAVSIEVRGHRVTLHGRVGDASAIGLIQALVEEVPGVIEIENRLVIT